MARSRLAVAVALVAGVAASAIAAGLSAAGGDAPDGTWRAVPDGPLSPRQRALGLWTGREVLVIGGSDAPPCPPHAGCAGPIPPRLRDGAAYDPRTRSWRRITAAPAGLEWVPSGVVLGRTAYVLAPIRAIRPLARRPLLAYSIRRDRWRRLRPLPLARRSEDPTLVDAGGRLVAYSSTDAGGEGPPARVYVRRTNRWRALPVDPFVPASARRMVWSGRRLIALACAAPEPPGSGPCLVRAAALDLRTGVWKRLPDSGVHFMGTWVRAGRRLVNPTLGSSDGGATDGWDGSHPNGGILVPAAGRWLPLPDPPSENHWEGTGVLTRTGAHYGAARGWVLDTTSDAWLRIPTPRADGQTVVAAGRTLFAFGGVRWRDGGRRGVLLGDASTWTPPPPR